MKLFDLEIEKQKQNCKTHPKASLLLDVVLN